MCENSVASTIDVLVVEDDDMTRQVFCRVAECLGHTVRSASTFNTACDEIKTRAPDLVLTDWDLKSNASGSGADVAAFSLTENPCTIVIMITGNDIDQLRRQTSSLSISAYVRKPVDLSGLRTILNEVLKS